ncbi:MAG: (2Fe-2S) ferredoxin domain-containing protein [Tannerellaceae bacterium]|nr:(2Fe-2S) ferredoxin domain-containing protein [Tannerellaceae bacterium]
MNKVKTLDDLWKMRESLRKTIDLREKSDNPENVVQIRVSMATCSIAAGAKEVMSYLNEALAREQVDALVTQTGCMGYCYAEPTIEVAVPGRKAVVFGHVNRKKVDEIITHYIKEGSLIDDIIPVTYNTVNPE